MAGKRRLSPRQSFQQSGGDMFAVLTDGTGTGAGKTRPPLGGAPKSDVLHIGTALVALNLGRDGAAGLIELLDALLTLIHASGLQRAGADMQQDVVFGEAHSLPDSFENKGAAESKTGRGAFARTRVDFAAARQGEKGQARADGGGMIARVMALFPIRRIVIPAPTMGEA